MQRFLRRVAVIGGARIPFCRSNTFYADLSNLDMMTGALNALVDRYNLKGQHIDEVVGGAVVTHSKDFNLTREAVLGTQPRASTPGITMMQACGTSLQGALGSAAKIATGEIDCAIAVGSDTTSDAPIVVSKKLAQRLTQGLAAEDVPRQAEGVQGLLAGRAGADGAVRRRAAHRAVDGRARRADGAGVGHLARRAGRRSRSKAIARRPRPTAPATWTISSCRSRRVYRDNNIREDATLEKLGDAEDRVRQDRARHADGRQLDAAHRRRRRGAARLGGVGGQARAAGAGLPHLLAGGRQRLRRRRRAADGADDRRLQDARPRRAEVAGLRLLRDPRGVRRAGAGDAEGVGGPRLLQGACSAGPSRWARSTAPSSTCAARRSRSGIRSRRPARASSPTWRSSCREHRRPRAHLHLHGRRHGRRRHPGDRKDAAELHQAA